MSLNPSNPPVAPLKRTPFHALHTELGARMVEFAGYDMPVQYPHGILKEHLHVRDQAGLFDVSHMGQLRLRPNSESVADAARALERLVPADILGLSPGRQCYTFFTNETGGILDDLMVAHLGDHYLLIVNAACEEADAQHLREHLSDDCQIERWDRALIALQGPKAEQVLASLTPDCAAMRFMDVAEMPIMGASCIVARSGYSGEDGFEISMPVDVAREIAEALLENPLVWPAGLGARDSLRLELGLPLSGADIDSETTPVEAGLQWAIPQSRRTCGARRGGFPGASIILEQLNTGVGKRRVGLRPEGRAPVRAGTPLYASGQGEKQIGTVTSGGFCPSLSVPIAMGYVPTAFAEKGTKIFALVRGQHLPMTVSAIPFIESRYKRS